VAHLSQEAKNIIVNKVLNRRGESIRAIAQQNNVGLTALGRWVRRAKLNANNAPLSKTLAAELKPDERFKHIVATATLSESERGAYCRSQGLYPFQLQEWQEAFIMGGPKESRAAENKLRSENKELREANALLQKDLHRKDKALAEASALLILKKKAALIWGDAEDDCSAVKNEPKP
jgi:transposase